MPSLSGIPSALACHGGKEELCGGHRALAAHRQSGGEGILQLRGKERDHGGGSSCKAKGRWRCSTAGHCRARQGDGAAPSGRRAGIAHACIAPTGTLSAGVVHILNCDTTGIAMLITDTDFRRKVVLLLPPCVVSTLKTESGALQRYLMADAFRNRR